MKTYLILYGMFDELYSDPNTTLHIDKRFHISVTRVSICLQEPLNTLVRHAGILL